ncbi:hypothetical protein KRZ98_13375 [Sphingobium sp. AS12]|uniref:hypothetical protein n=1 Tax=Sphingobium sp. AS12 TaxID=2849495 RepID=UPI001C3180F7|nr:hypothetical protein [Sphingobium sp. AS12]MBV2149262.1 hypothetical protein [Sphingobium sp. AS12]
MDMPTIIKTAPRRKHHQQAEPVSRPEITTTGIAIPYTAFQCLLFVCSTLTLIFTMCATGRAGA